MRLEGIVKRLKIRCPCNSCQNPRFHILAKSTTYHSSRVLIIGTSRPCCDVRTSPHGELLLPSTTAQEHTYLSREGRTMPHWQLPFLGLHAFPVDLTAVE